MKKHGNQAQHKKAPKNKESRLRGTISTTGKGIGFFAHPSLKEDALIEAGFLNTALNGDEVEIILHPLKKGERQKGEVVKIHTRAKREFVGTLKKIKNSFFLMPDDRKMYVDIVIPKENLKGAVEGQKIQVKITEWAHLSENPEGEVVQVIGNRGEHETEIQSIILERGIDTHFPPEVLKEAEEIEKREKPLPQSEITRRRDFRNVLTFTIDPKDAKDFDDAISYKELPGGNLEIGVHIADVSHYVIEGTKLDEEALSRGCSVYLVDRTIPMLPEVLSNDLCSLNPREDKFAFSAVFVMTRQGKVLERWFGKTVINSNKRFSYEEAQDRLDAKQGEHYLELNDLNSIAKILRAEKMKEGAIDFEQEEVRFELDPSGKPIRVYKKQRLDTHKLVEEYMLLANREVAEFIYTTHAKKGGKGLSIYRIHDLPDKDRIAQLSIFLKALGHNLHIKNGKISAQDINAMLKKIEGKAEEALIKTATIRSMAKAIYSTKNIGHFGLGFKYYTHFTSPIRRYPDLMVQRILQNIIVGDKKKAQNEFTMLERIAAESTEKEIAAAEAERASIKYKQVEFMSDKVGREFDGIISGITEWGIYIEEVETKAEGMIRLKDMSDDFYVLDEKTYSLKGSRTGKKYTLGDKVKVKLTKADLDSKTLDYAIVNF